MRLLRRALALTLVFVCFSLGSQAADITSDTHGRSAEVYLEGPITVGDAGKIKDLIAVMNNEGRVVFQISLFSSGGDVVEAMKISKILNDKLVVVVAPGRPSSQHDLDTGLSEVTESYCARTGRRIAKENCVCNSSCAIIWLTANLRRGEYIGVHRPRFRSEYFSGLSVVQAKEKYAEMLKGVTNYLLENDVPSTIVNTMMSVSSGDIHILTPKEIRSVENGRPFMMELLRAKCAEFESDYQQIQILKRKYWELSDHYDSLDVTVGYEYIKNVGVKMLAAMDEYHRFERDSRFYSCAFEQENEARLEAQLRRN